MSGVFDKIVEVLPSLPNELPRIIKTERFRDESEADKLVDDCDQIDLETSFDEDQVSLPSRMSCVVRKPVFWVSYQVQHKLDCIAAAVW